MKKEFITGTIVLFLLLAVNANAYLDAGAGSYLIQIVIGFFAAGLFSLKLFWKKILSLFKAIRNGNKK